jgi:tetratricopeptide (TPR) repeat protein
VLDGSAVRSRLVVRITGQADEARRTVILSRPKGVRNVQDYSQPRRPDMLPREMVRQALLIAARDELGLATRDEVIDETSADEKEPGAATLELISYILDNRAHVLVRRIEKGKGEVVLAHETPTPPGKSLDLVKLLAGTERLSREEFPGILKGIGLASKPRVVKDAAVLPEKVEERLESLEFVDTMTAVRELHGVMRADGESPERLGALARGYALLGVLSEFHWHPAHRAYKARALLYAQRLLARGASRREGLRNRAFVLALVGRHGDALADLDEAKKADDAKVAAVAPEWAELADAYCRNDIARLSQVEGQSAKLARLLRMFILAFPRSTAAGLQAAKDVLLLQPYCFRAHDAMADFFGVSTQHVTSMIGPQALAQFLSTKLPTINELPGEIRERLGDAIGVLRSAKLLDQAGMPESDTGEPSWGALGHMVRETRFVQVFRRLYFTKVMLASPTEDEWKSARPEVEGHRYLPYLDSLANQGRDAAETLSKFAAQVDLVDIETTETPMNRSLWTLGTPRAKAAWTIAMAHEDETAEMALSLAQAADKGKPEIARAILKVSPYHAYARAVLVRLDWEKVKDQVPAWEMENRDSPALLAALGLHFADVKNPDEAQRLFTRYIELSPDAWAYRSLAATYKQLGKVDRWLGLLEEFLNKVEDPGLDHASVRVEIANHYMNLKEWEKASPYAEAAAETWAQWAMDCAARCAEGQKGWQRAESWYSRETERYPDNCWAVWYFFCKRTDQGDLAAAREVVQKYLSERADRPDLLNEEFAGCFYWLEGQLEKAKVAFRKAFRTRTSVSAGLALAMIADEEKDAPRRQELLTELVRRHKEKAPKSLEICKLLLETILDPDHPGPVDFAALDRLMESIPDEGRGNACFFVGRFLRNHGEAETARKYLGRCRESQHSLGWYRAMAREASK